MNLFTPQSLSLSTNVIKCLGVVAVLKINITNYFKCEKILKTMKADIVLKYYVAKFRVFIRTEPLKKFDYT